MTEPSIKLPQTPANGSLTRAPGPDEADDLPVEVDSSVELTDESPPGTPRWVKALGIVLVVLLLAFAGLHLTGNVPNHMAGASDGAHGMQSP